jgi:5-bromo-4-chloroindolyl phosphate hydrolysis protein
MTPFRNWVHNLWLDNCEERMLYFGGERLSKREYFQKFKWWLKKEYQYYRQTEIQKEKLNERFRKWA